MVRWSFFVTFAAMIQELPIYEDPKACYNEPLLEYVVKVSENFWPFYDTKKRRMVRTHVPEEYYKRLLSGKIVITPKVKETYLEAKEVLRTLDAYGLDYEKFWYLCVLLIDFSEGQTIESSIENPTHRQEIELLISELGKLTPNQSFFNRISRFEPCRPSNAPLPQSNKIKTIVDGVLTLKIGSVKSVKIYDGQTLVIIREALEEMFKHRLRHYNDYIDSSPIRPYKTYTLGIQYRVALFYKYMMWFLKQYTPHKDKKISTDRRLLISRLIYVLGIDDDLNYYDKNELHTTEGKITYLKNKIKRIKDQDLPVQNKNYLLRDD